MRMNYWFTELVVMNDSRGTNLSHPKPFACHIENTWRSVSWTASFWRSFSDGTRLTWITQLFSVISLDPPILTDVSPESLDIWDYFALSKSISDARYCIVWSWIHSIRDSSHHFWCILIPLRDAPKPNIRVRVDSDSSRFGFEKVRVG